MGIYVNVTQFITGTGNHHDPRMMKVKFGNLMNTLLTDIKNKIYMDKEEKHKSDGRVSRREKLAVYSTVCYIIYTTWLRYVDKVEAWRGRLSLASLLALFAFCIELYFRMSFRFLDDMVNLKHHWCLFFRVSRVISKFKISIC